MIANWILLLGIALPLASLLVGIWRGERNVGYEPTFVTFFFWLGFALLIAYLAIYFKWSSLSGF